MESLIYGILPLVPPALFLCACTLRILNWIRRPLPYQLTLFPVPAEEKRRAALATRELLFFGALFRENRPLWFPAWLLHLSLLLILGGHILGISLLRGQFVLLGVSMEASAAISRSLGALTGLIMAVSLVVLLCRRMLDRELRRLTEPAGWFDLLLLLALTSSGLGMYLPGFHADLPAVRQWLAGLLLLAPVPFPQNPLFRLHLWLAALLLLYFPFSQLMHAAGALVNRTMLMEEPPSFPTPEDRRLRSPFAENRATCEESRR